MEIDQGSCFFLPNTVHGFIGNCFIQCKALKQRIEPQKLSVITQHSCTVCGA